MSTTPEQRARRLAGFLAFAGTSHFLVPGQYDAIVPHRLPGRPRTWTYLSGAAELACAAAVARQSTRHLGGRLAFWLFIAVFPGNVQMAIDWRDRPATARAVSLIRLPMQLPMLAWARQVERDAAP